jgi:hypothetical protein
MALVDCAAVYEPEVKIWASGRAPQKFDGNFADYQLGCPKTPMPIFQPASLAHTLRAVGEGGVSHVRPPTSPAAAWLDSDSSVGCAKFGPDDEVALREFFSFRIHYHEGVDDALTRYDLVRIRAQEGGLAMNEQGHAYVLLMAFAISSEHYPFILQPTAGRLPRDDVERRVFVTAIKKHFRTVGRKSVSDGIDLTERPGGPAGAGQARRHHDNPDYSGGGGVDSVAGSWAA